MVMAGGRGRAFLGQQSAHVQKAQRVVDGGTRHGRCLRIQMLATFHRDGVTAMGPHVFGGSDAVGDAAVLATAYPLGVGGQPAIDQAPGADGLRQAFFLGRTPERLQLFLVVGRAEEHEGLARRREGVQVHQHVVAGQDRPQAGGDAILDVLGRQAGAEVAVQVAVALAAAGGPGHRIGHGHEGEGAAMQDATALGEFRQDLPDGDGSCRLVAMHTPHHQQARARAQRVVLVDLDDARGTGFGGLGGVGERVGHGESGEGRERGRAEACGSRPA